MALTLSALATAAMASAGDASAAADALGALLDGGTLTLYDGTRPATADTAVTDQVRLGAPTFADPACAAAAAGVITAHALTDDPDAAASGIASWFRAVTSGDDPVCDGAVGTNGAECVLSSTTILQHGVVAITQCVFTVVPT